MNEELMESVKCPVCATSNLAAAVFCVECGYLLQEEQPLVEGAAPATANVPATGWIVGLPDGTEVALVAGENLVGRTEGAVLISDGFVSRKHAYFVVDVASLKIEDLGSTNGTFVDGVRLSPHMPVPVDEKSDVKIGQTPITLTYIPSDNLPKPAEPESALPPAPEEKALLPVEDVPALEPVHMLEPTLAEQLEEEVEEAKEETAVEGLSEYVLAVTEGGPAPDTKLKMGTTTFGRKADKADVAYSSDAFISGLHFAVDVTAEGVFITDLGSTNGTFIAGDKIEPNEKVPINEGTEIAVGKTKLVLRKA